MIKNESAAASANYRGWQRGDPVGSGDCALMRVMKRGVCVLCLICTACLVLDGAFLNVKNKVVLDATLQRWAQLFASEHFSYTELVALEKRIAAQPTLPHSQVPKVIHQSWITSRMDEQMARWVRSWQVYHPGWLHILWTDAMLRTLFDHRFPAGSSVRELFEQYPLSVQKCDLARLVLLQRYGGLYADADFEAKAAFDDALSASQCQAFVVESPHKPAEHFQNSLMASRQNHTFLSALAEKMRRRWDEVQNGTRPFGVLGTTGPHVVDDVMVSLGYRWDKKRVHWGVTPISWNESSVCQLGAREYYAGTYARHHLRNSWNDGVFQAVHKRTGPRLSGWLH